MGSCTSCCSDAKLPLGDQGRFRASRLERSDEVEDSLEKPYSYLADVHAIGYTEREPHCLGLYERVFKTGGEQQ
jgi:hypothetical protein